MQEIRSLNLDSFEACKPRMEDKYILSGSMLRSARAYLQSKCRMRIFNHEVSQVNSLYLDTRMLSRVEDNLAGVAQREKLRFRWYDSPLPENYCYLELKKRNGKLTAKERCRFHASASSRGAMLNVQLHRIAGMVPDSIACHLISGDVPVLIIRYLREHFQLDQLPIRFTLDYSMRAVHVSPFPPFLPVGIERSFGAPILEVKYAPEHTKNYRELNCLGPLNLRKERCSKYIQACKTLGSILGKQADRIEHDGRKKI